MSNYCNIVDSYNNKTYLAVIQIERFHMNRALENRKNCIPEISSKSCFSTCGDLQQHQGTITILCVIRNWSGSKGFEVQFFLRFLTIKMKLICLYCPLSLTSNENWTLFLSQVQYLACFNKVLIELWINRQISSTASKEFGYQSKCVRLCMRECVFTHVNVSVTS